MIMHFSKKGSDKMLVLKLTSSFLIAALYFIVIKILINRTYPYSYYYEPNISMLLTIVNCGIFIILGITITYKNLISLLQHKVVLFIASFLLISMILLPIGLLKCGTLANDYSIQKKNAFGKTICELKYEDIESIDISVRSGIQYDIKFKTGESIFLCSHNAGMRNFKNDINLQNFDKMVSQYTDKTVTADPAWVRPSNTRRFFHDENVFKYFDDFFKTFYLYD